MWWILQNWQNRHCHDQTDLKKPKSFIGISTRCEKMHDTYEQLDRLRVERSPRAIWQGLLQLAGGYSATSVSINAENSVGNFKKPDAWYARKFHREKTCHSQLRSGSAIILEWLVYRSRTVVATIIKFLLRISVKPNLEPTWTGKIDTLVDWLWSLQ